MDNEMIEAWKKAAEDLGIEIVPAFELHTILGKFTSVLLVKKFGAATGTLVFTISDKLPPEGFSDLFKGYYLSRLGDGYSIYDRQKFIEALNDWGYFGPAPAPDWYTGEPWG